MTFKKILANLKKIFNDFWILALSLALLLIIVNLIIVPIYKKIIGLQRQIAIEKNELETKYIRRQTIRRTLSSLQHTKVEWPKLYNSFYPQFGREVVFLDVLERLADTYNLSQNIRLEPTLASPLGAGDIQIVPMQLFLIGNFANIIAYMHSLENQTYILHLKSLKIIRTESNGAVQADLRYDTYWRNKN